MAFQVRKTQWDIEELNKGARREGFKSWEDFKNSAIDKIKKRNISGRILKNIERNNGKYVVPLTNVEARALASKALTKQTWASATKAYPDFKDAMKKYLDDVTTNSDLKKINKLKISLEKKWNMMSGKQKQDLFKFSENGLEVWSTKK